MPIELRPGLVACLFVLLSGCQCGRAGELGGLSYGTSELSWKRGVEIAALAPEELGGGTFVVHPELPPGISLDSSTGVLSGTPSEVRPATAHEITFTSELGNASTTLTLTVFDRPALSYGAAVQSVVNVPLSISPLTLHANESEITGCALASGSPALPSGLSLHPTTCILSGTPTAITSAVTYSIEATNAGGASIAAPLTLTVNPPALVTLKDCDACGTPSGTPTHDFGSVASGTTINAFFFVHNAGPGPVIISNGGMTGAAFSFSRGAYPGGAPSGLAHIGQTDFTFCPASGQPLAGGATCVLQVSYSASGSTLQTGAFTLTLEGATTPAVSHNLTGTPTHLGIITLTDCPTCSPSAAGDTPTYDFGTVASPGTRSAFFLVKNSGNGTVTLTQGVSTGTAFAFAGGYPGGTPGSNVVAFGGNHPFCPASGGNLSGHSSCVLKVTYTASGEVQQTGSFALSLGGATTLSAGYNLTAKPTSDAIIELRDCANCTVSSGSGTPTHAFGGVASPSNTDAFFWVTNRGSSGGKLITAAIATTSGPTGTFRFATGAFPGGPAGGAVTINGSAFNYCPTLGSTLAAGVTCVLKVRYAATGTSPQAGALTLGLQNATVASLGYQLTGNPTTRAVVKILNCVGCGIPEAYDFGVWGSNVSQLFVVSNSGAVQAGLADGLALEAPFSFTTGSFPGGSGNTFVEGVPLPFCGATLAAGASCAVSIRFSGQSDGADSVTLNLTGATEATAQRTVLGTAIARALLMVSESGSRFGCTDSTCGGNPSSFGPIAAGTVLARHYVVTNRGALSTTVLAQGSPFSADFGFGSTGVGAFPGGAGTAMVDGVSFPYCTARLPAGEQCVVTIAYRPSAPSSRSDALNFTYADSAGAVTPSGNRYLRGTAQ